MSPANRAILPSQEPCMRKPWLFSGNSATTGAQPAVSLTWEIWRTNRGITARPVPCTQKACSSSRNWDRNAVSRVCSTASRALPLRSRTRNDRSALRHLRQHCEKCLAHLYRRRSKPIWRKFLIQREAHCPMQLPQPRGWMAGQLQLRKLFRTRWRRTDTLLCRGGIDHVADRRDPIRRETSLGRMLPDRSLVRSQVHTIDLVPRDVAVQPLNLRTHCLENVHRFLRDLAKFAV